MKPIALRIRSIAIALAIPVGGMAISYAFLIDSPLRAKIAEVQNKLAKQNETIQQREAEHSANLRMLEDAQQSRLAFEKLASTAPPATLDVTVNAGESIDVADTDSSLSRLSATVALFDCYQLICLGSEVIESSNVESQSSLERTGNENVRLKLIGTFSDMHRALAALRATIASVDVVSLDMEASPPDSSAHQWSVILRIEGR